MMKNILLVEDFLLKIYMPAFHKNLADYSSAVFNFLKAPPQSLVGFYAAATLDQNKYESPLINYADGIDTSLRDNPAVKNFVGIQNKAKILAISHKAPESTINQADGKPVKLSGLQNTSCSISGPPGVFPVVRKIQTL